MKVGLMLFFVLISKISFSMEEFIMTPTGSIKKIFDEKIELKYTKNKDLYIVSIKEEVSVICLKEDEPDLVKMENVPYELKDKTKIQIFRDDCADMKEEYEIEKLENGDYNFKKAFPIAEQVQ